MFQFRTEQIEAFKSSLAGKADQSLIKYALSRFPSRFSAIDDSSNIEFVMSVRASAKHYGIERENDVATFLDFVVMYGLDFPKAPWADDVMHCQEIHGPDKMALLRFRVQETGVTL